MRLCRVIIAVLVIGTIVAAADVPPSVPSLPAGGKPLISEEPLSSYEVLEVGRRFAEFGVISGQEQRPFLRVNASAVPPQWWDIQVRWAGDAPIGKGDTVLLSLRMRTASAQTQTGEATGNVCVQRTSSPWDSALSTDFHVGRQWQRIDLPFQAQSDFAAGTYQVALNLGFGVQSVDIADVLLLNYGQKLKAADLPRFHLSYPGRETDAPWRKEAEKRITALRMADLKVRVTDAAGRALLGATVQARMTRQAFPFGTTVDAAWLDPQENNSDARKYRELLPTLFNRAAFDRDMKWAQWESARARIADHKARLWRCIEWMEANGLDVRGGEMIWPGSSSGDTQMIPDDLRALIEAKDSAKLGERIRGRIMEIGGEFQGHIAEWDVVNEPASNHVLQDVLGPQSIAEWFNWARHADPRARLYINDFCILSGGAADEQRIDRLSQIMGDLKTSGAPVDGIGEEGHFAAALVGPVRMLELLDRFSAYGWPIEITQFDQSTDDEQLQADYLRDFYTAAFSHPGINGITMCGFWEGQSANRNAALLRKDWSLKANGQAYIDLVRKRWWTDKRGVTDEQGTFAVRGFLGDYEITVTTPEGTKQALKANLNRTSAPIVVTMK